LRLLETLENLRDRIDILSDQANRIQERQLNQSSYVFAVVSTIFLPLNFVTACWHKPIFTVCRSPDAAMAFWVIGVGLWH
jgi:zinc transporter